MYKLFVVTFAMSRVVDTRVIDYNEQCEADVAATKLTEASGKSFNCVITKLY